METGIQNIQAATPIVSIVLPVYNGERFLRSSIESVLGQTFEAWELIIVDDCSTDGSGDIIKKYAEIDSRIRIIHNEVNRKLPASLNIGFAEAKCDYLTWTSDDNIYLPQALEKMVSFLAENNDYAAVTARMTQIDDNGKFMRVFDAYDPGWMWFCDLMGLCFMYRRAVLEKIGGYDENLFLVEDYDYWLRIREYCGPIGAIDEILYVYRYHQNSLTVKKQNEVAAKLQIMRRKHMPYILQGLKDNVLALHYLYDAFLRNEETDYIQNELKKILPGIERERFDFPEGEYIILGTGEFAEELLKEFGEKVQYLADINPGTVGQVKEGRRIISFADVLKKIDEGAMLLIAVPIAQNYEVIRQATAAGLREYRTYWGYKRTVVK